MNKAKGLVFINLFGEVTMKKGIVNVHLAKRLAIRDCNGENDFDGL